MLVEGVDKPPISSWHLTATSSPEAVDDEEEVLALVRDHQGHVLCVDDVWWDLVSWADLGRAVVAALVDIGFLADLEVAMGRPNRTATIVVVMGLRD